MLKEVLQQIRLAHPRIHVLGEFISDQWYLGRQLRPAQEDPKVLVFVADNEFGQQGGAAGVYHNLQTILWATDEKQVTYVSAVCRAGYSTRHRYWNSDTNTLVFRHDVDMQQNILDVEFYRDDPKNIVISDYGKGMFDWKTLRSLADRYPDYRFVFSPHVTTCRKAKGEDLGFLERENWTMVVNAVDERAALDCAGQHLGRQRIVITHGAGGVSAAEWNDLVGFEVPVEKIDVLHAIAIGDVFLAGFSAAWFSGIELVTSIIFAVECCKSALTTWEEGSHAISSEGLGSGNLAPE